MESAKNETLRLGLPKGRQREALLGLLQAAGIHVEAGARGYRPRLSLPGFETKLLKPQNIVEMLRAGTRDLGFTGADWVAELGAGGPDGLVELLDTELDPTRLVAAAPESLLEGGKLPARPLVIASEFERLTRAWIAERGLRARFVRSYGATEVFPPEDADCVVDLVSTGSTLRANALVEVEEVLTSSTRLYAHAGVLEDDGRRRRVERFVLLLRSVLDARRRVMLELNVPGERLDGIVRALPCMREPTVAQLAHGDGFAVRAAVPRDTLPDLIPSLKAAGGMDLVITELAQIVS